MILRLNIVIVYCLRVSISIKLYDIETRYYLYKLMLSLIIMYIDFLLLLYLLHL